MIAGRVCRLVCFALMMGGVARAQRAEELPEAPGQSAAVGGVRGRVTDSNGAPVAGARVVLRRGDQEAVTSTSEDGAFAFAGAGAYRIAVEAAGFAPGSAVGDQAEVGAMVLRTAGTTMSVDVSATREEVAAAQVAEEETQRVFGAFPNFYVAYSWDAAPLTKRQKLGLAWRTTRDPVSLALTGVVAGVEQARNDFSGFGHGAAGYGRRYGAALGDETISTFVSGALLPIVFRQDPRYFYKGTGTVKRRAWYAVESAVMCRSDRGKWEPNYSNLLGNLVTGAISNAYYPAENRNGAALTFENGLLGTVGAAAGNLLEEFVLRKVTRRQ